MAPRAGLRPAAAGVPAGGAAAAEADRPAQPKGAAPAALAPRPGRPGQSRGARPRGPGRGERRRMGRCVGVRRWGWERLGGSPPVPRSGPRRRGGGVRTARAWGTVPSWEQGPLPGLPGLVPAPRPPPGARGLPSSGLRPAARPAAPAVPPVVRPGCKSPVALAATRGPARAAASRRSRRSAGTPPSAPAWSVRPGPATRGRQCVRPQLQVRAALTGRQAEVAPGPRARDPAPDPQNLEVWLLSILCTGQHLGPPPSGKRGGRRDLLATKASGFGMLLAQILPLCLAQRGRCIAHQDLSSSGVCTDNWDVQ